MKGGKKAYFNKFNVVEVQETFYKLPKSSTVKKWAESAPPGFEFTMKIWQVVTHPPTSPTWKRAGLTVPKSKYKRYGFLRPTEENYSAWEKAMEICKAMGAKVCVVQCPASFKYSEENIENLREFFSTVDRRDVEIGWEPRGDWREYLDTVKKICDELDLIHVVDPFRVKPASSHGTIYFRLHGIGGRETNYSYKYTGRDLRKLLDMLKLFEREGREEAYVMFNNIRMAEDAERFKNLLSK